MGGWRSKIVFLLVVYFAGFATAIYCLAPAPESTHHTGKKSTFLDTLSSDDFAQSFNSGMHKCFSFSKDAAGRAGKFIKQKLDERQTES